MLINEKLFDESSVHHINMCLREVEGVTLIL
jgi:hypothetical protein